MKNILSFGAGVQSTTLLLMSCVGVLPKLDHVIFADTQWEPAAVYAHLEWCKEFADKHGIEIAVRTVGNLREDLLEFWGQRKSADGKRHASIPAFVKNPDGSRGIVRRQCTGTYKIEVIERFIREEVLGLKKGQRWPLTPVVRQWIGISRDEWRRMKKAVRPAVQFWHPLIQSNEIGRIRPGQFFVDGFDRRDCLNWLENNGFPKPPRSACIGCPFHSNEEWAALTPEEFSDACSVDRLIRENDRNRERRQGELIGDPFLHASLIPLSEVDLGRESDADQSFDNECAGVCGV